MGGRGSFERPMSRIRTCHRTGRQRRAGSSRLCAYLSPRIEGAELVPVQEQADQTQPIRKRISRQCQANTSPDWQFEIFEESTPPYRNGGLIFSRDSERDIRRNRAATSLCQARVLLQDIAIIEVAT